MHCDKHDLTCGMNKLSHKSNDCLKGEQTKEKKH